MNPPVIHTVNNNNNNFPGSGMPQIDLTTKIKIWWDSVPLFIKFIILSTSILYILNLFIPFISFFFANIPYYTILKFQIWRLATNAFITTSLLNIIFAFLSWIKDACDLEKSNGTLKYMLIFFMNSILIQIIYSLLLLFISLVIHNKSVLKLNLISGYVENNGLWPIIMSELTLLCMMNPENPIRIFFLLVKEKQNSFHLCYFYYLCYLMECKLIFQFYLEFYMVSYIIISLEINYKFQINIYKN